MKISLITTTYNCAGTLNDFLDSVASQTHDDIEHWVIDGCSSNGTVALVESRHQDLSGMISEPDNGIYDALNKDFALFTSDIIGILHSDDRFYDFNTLARVVGAFEDPSVDYVYGDIEMV